MIWITGASRGLGRELALSCAAAGAELVLSARSAEPLEELCAEVRAGGGAATALPGSIVDPEFASGAAAAIEHAHGGLDVLVNNAGISPYFKRAEQLSAAEVREVVETNLIGSFECCRAASPLLAAAAEASVVNVSSIHGSRAHPRLLAYAASKGGIEMLTRSLAVEWAPRGIRVNSLAPGYIETEMTAGLRENPGLSAEILDRVPLGRFATAQEIAACAVFLASPASSYVTGTTLFADGGWSAR